MHFGNVNFVEEPQKIDRDIYSKYIDKYLESVKKNSDVLSVYQMGNINCPGISDIDLIVVVRDNSKTTNLHELSVKNVFNNDKLSEYLFLHDVMIVNQKTFYNIYYLAYIDNMKLLYGPDLEIKSISPEEQKVINLSILADFSILRLHQFKKNDKNNIFPVRGNIVRASSILHSMLLGKLLGFPVNQPLKNDLLNLRNQWFNTLDTENVNNLLIRVRKNFYDIVLRCSEYFKENFLLFYERDYENRLLLLSDNFQDTIFVSNNEYLNINKNKDLDIVFSNIHNNQTSVIYYPSILFFHYLTYLELFEEYTKNISNKFLNGNQIYEVQPEYYDTMKNRVQYLWEYTNFISHNSLYFVNTPFYPGFNIFDL